MKQTDVPLEGSKLNSAPAFSDAIQAVVKHLMQAAMVRPMNAPIGPKSGSADPEAEPSPEVELLPDQKSA